MYLFINILLISN